MTAAASLPKHRPLHGRAAEYRAVRARTEALAAPLSPEDCQIQSMPDASPVKWHLAHGSWFFETFILASALPDYRPFDPAYAVLFNSYYVAVGDRHPRPQRGLLSRPSLEEVRAYRRHVDAGMAQLFERGLGDHALITLGLHHEQQHQELILMDVLHALSCNPLEPAYDPAWRMPGGPAGQSREWIAVEGGLHAIGHDGEGFAFDNEGPLHKVWLEPFRIATSLVTCGDYLEFIADGGYARPQLWLSDGWDQRVREDWQAPSYWRKGDCAWTRFTLAGRVPVDPAEPVCHISHYEADAYARWKGARLPTEAEWEVAVRSAPLAQINDTLWQWTQSPYTPYPGFTPGAGAVGEYNGKFMANQMVLRGGSFATPAGHARPTYRNFFAPHCRWQFAGIRLADNR